jgi:Na+-translocating ferredoxin:NAD+ oxidoreductase RnfD subunit
MPETPTASVPRAVTREAAARLSPAAVASYAARPLPTHSGMTLDRFFGLHVMGAMLPVSAGFALYGWRAIAMLGFTIGTSMLAVAVWRGVGPRGHQVSFSHTLWLSLLLGLTLPPHLISHAPLYEGAPPALWAVVPSAAILLVIFTWLLGGVGSARVHPVLVTYLFLVALLGPPANSADLTSALTPHWVLQRTHLVSGDIVKATSNLGAYAQEGWLGMPPLPAYDALAMDPASQRLISFTTATQRREQNWLSLDGLLRDEMPPLEDLIIGGQPGPLGGSCAIAVIVGGLFLLYRGVIDFRIPFFTCLGAFAAFLVLPIPLVITEVGVQWRWLAIRQPGISPATAVTFANYEMMAGPLLLMAGAGHLCPDPRRAQRVHAALRFGLLRLLRRAPAGQPAHPPARSFFPPAAFGVAPSGPHCGTSRVTRSTSHPHN